MLKDPRVNQAFQMYEEKLDQHYPVSIWSQLHLSKESEEKLFQAVKKKTHRLKWKRAFVRVGEGLAVAAVFCMMAYAVYLAAQGPKDPIVAGTAETETEEIAETAKTEETYDKIDKILKENIDYEIMHASKKQIYPIVKDVIKNTLRRKTLAEMMFGIGMEYFYLYHDVEKAELIIESLFSVINQEEYSVPELEGTDVKEAFSWRYRDRKTGTERVIGYREFMIDTMNMYFRRAASQVLVPETGIEGYRIFVEKVLQSPYRDQVNSYTLDGTTFTVENFSGIFEQVQLERQKDPDFWKKLKHGDIVFFGRYEQDGIAENGPEAIQWKVCLNSQTDTLSLLSVYDLDIMQWTTDYTKKEANYWANSEIRAWLNGEFYQSAFTAEEKEMIQLTHLVNDWEILPWPGMSEHRGSGGPDTEDYVFLFSIKEDSDTNPFYGYPRSPYAANPTAYAEAKAKQYEHLDTKTPFTWYRGGDRRMGPYWETDGMQAYGFVAPMIKLEIPVSE